MSEASEKTRAWCRAADQRMRAEAAEARAAELEKALRGLVVCGVELCSFCEEEPALWWREAGGPFSEQVCDDCRRDYLMKGGDDYPDPVRQAEVIRAALRLLTPPTEPSRGDG